MITARARQKRHAHKKWSEMKVGYGLFLRELRLEHSRSQLFWLWNLLAPLVYALVFLAIYPSRMVPVEGIQIPYLWFVASGIMGWFCFQDALLAGMRAVERSQGLTSQVMVKPLSIGVATLWLSLYFAAFRLASMLLVLLYVGLPWWAIGASFLGLSLAVLIGLGVGFCLAPFHAVLPDIGRVVQMLLPGLMFSSNTLLPISPDGRFGWIYHINPLVTLWNQIRLHAIPDAGAIASWGTVSLVAVGLLTLGGYVLLVGMPVVVQRSGD